jgi:hypothetical protein
MSRIYVYILSIYEKKILGLVVLISCFTYPLFSQSNYFEYYKLVRKAKVLEIDNKHDSALIFFENAFKLVDFVHEENLKIAIKTAKKLKKNDLQLQYTSQLQLQKKNIDRSYVDAINKIIKLDQSVRNSKYEKAKHIYYNCMQDTGCNKNQKEFLKAKIMMNHWWYVDSISISELLNLISQKGFPGERKVGHEASESAYIVMLHYDLDKENKKLNPMLLEALAHGDIKPRDYGLIVDRRMIFANKEAVYYVAPFGLDKLTKEQKEEVDKKRVKIGLPTLADGQKIIQTKNSFIVTYID